MLNSCQVQVFNSSPCIIICGGHVVFDLFYCIYLKNMTNEGIAILSFYAFFLQFNPHNCIGFMLGV